MTIQAIETTGERLSCLRSALLAANLPADDIELPGRTFFEFEEDGATVGWGGFELHGTDGLLRSVVVEPSFRSKGIGSSLLTLIEHLAAERGATRLHLLTTSASRFFEQQGYQLQPRGTEPTLIAQTEQFKHLCPGSASYLCKTVAGAA